jgi:hypothetical protein
MESVYSADMMRFSQASVGAIVDVLHVNDVRQPLMLLYLSLFLRQKVRSLTFKNQWVNLLPSTVLRKKRYRAIKVEHQMTMSDMNLYIATPVADDVANTTDKRSQIFETTNFTTNNRKINPTKKINHDIILTR